MVTFCLEIFAGVSWSQTMFGLRRHPLELLVKSYSRQFRLCDALRREMQSFGVKCHEPQSYSLSALLFFLPSVENTYLEKISNAHLANSFKRCLVPAVSKTHLLFLLFFTL